MARTKKATKKAQKVYKVKKRVVSQEVFNDEVEAWEEDNEFYELSFGGTPYDLYEVGDITDDWLDSLWAEDDMMFD